MGITHLENRQPTGPKAKLTPKTGKSKSVPPGESRLRAALQRRRKAVRQENPTPYDEDWGWWVEQRLARIEGQGKWLLRLVLGVLAAEGLRVTLAYLKIP